MLQSENSVRGMRLGWNAGVRSKQFGLGHLQTTIVVVFVAASLMLGGGGSSAPKNELIIQLIAALALIAWLLADRTRVGSAVDRQTLALAGIVIALPCLQLVPLPPAIWQSFPGREQQGAALALVGGAGDWMPWSQAPASTLAVLLAMLPPLVVMVMVAMLDLAGRGRVIAAVAVVTGISLVLGALQLSSGAGGNWRLYGSENGGFLNGFQANRNAQADVVLIGMVAAVLCLLQVGGRMGRHIVDALLIGITAIFILGCVLTGSRAGIALIPLALAAVVFLRLEKRVQMRKLLAIITALILAGLAAVFALLQTGPGVRVFERFALGSDFRWQLWQDTLAAIDQTWPFGSGMGSFRPAFIAAERLEMVDPTRPVGAHNDYLELALEGGVFGLVLLAIAITWLGRMARSVWNSGNILERRQIVFALAVFLIIALHSVVDYPMRSMAIACLGGIAAGLVAKLPVRQKNGIAVQ